MELKTNVNPTPPVNPEATVITEPEAASTGQVELPAEIVASEPEPEPQVSVVKQENVASDQPVAVIEPGVAEITEPQFQTAVIPPLELQNTIIEHCGLKSDLWGDLIEWNQKYLLYLDIDTLFDGPCDALKWLMRRTLINSTDAVEEYCGGYEQMRDADLQRVLNDKEIVDYDIIARQLCRNVFRFYAKQPGANPDIIEMASRDNLKRFKFEVHKDYDPKRNRVKMSVRNTLRPFDSAKRRK